MYVYKTALTCIYPCKRRTGAGDVNVASRQVNTSLSVSLVAGVCVCPFEIPQKHIADSGAVRKKVKQVKQPSKQASKQAYR